MLTARIVSNDQSMYSTVPSFHASTRSVRQFYVLHSQIHLLAPESLSTKSSAEFIWYALFSNRRFEI